MGPDGRCAMERYFCLDQRFLRALISVEVVLKGLSGAGLDFAVAPHFLSVEPSCRRAIEDTEEIGADRAPAPESPEDVAVPCQDAHPELASQVFAISAEDVTSCARQADR
jgi:hypothetical protein